MLGAMSRVPAASLVAALALAGFAACEPIQENVPDVSGFNVNRPSAPPSNPNAGDSGTGGAFDPATYCNGGPVLAPAGTACDISFESDIYPLMKTGSSACGAQYCHQAVTDKAPNPLGGTTTAAQVWQTLVTYGFRGPEGQSLPYINVCSVDPTQSGIHCNLEIGSKLCGERMPQGSSLPQQDKDAIAEWLTCGAPNN